LDVKSGLPIPWARGGSKLASTWEVNHWLAASSGADQPWRWFRVALPPGGQWQAGLPGVACWVAS
jgi:hypothetical protein